MDHTSATGPQKSEVSDLGSAAADEATDTETSDIPVAGTATDNRFVNAEAFFRTSQLTDQLRDTAKLLLRRSNPSQATVTQMAEAYKTLRARLGDEIVADLVEQTMELTPEIDPATASADQVVFGTAQLARWLDSIEAGPAYLLSRRVNAANAVELGAKVDQILADDQAVKDKVADDVTPRGSYL